MLLKGKNALITGGSSGIGLEVARCFLREGARVLITGQNEARLETAKGELGGKVLVARVRSEDRSDDRVLFEAARNAFGTLDILFLNAGITTPRSFRDTSEAILDREFSVNFKGPFFATQALLPLLRKGGSIIFNTSCLDQLGPSGVTAYAASKAALRSLVRTLARELLPYGIRVNSVAPGPIETPNMGKLGFTPENMEKVRLATKEQVPLGRFGTPAEVAGAVLFLASDQSSFLLGEEITVDGGWTNL